MKRSYGLEDQTDFTPSVTDYSKYVLQLLQFTFGWHIHHELSYINVSLSRTQSIVAGFFVLLFLLFTVAILITMTVYIVKYNDETGGGST